MEDGARNGGLSGGVVKNRNSTGCLIIKNKGDREGGGSAYSGPDIVYTRKDKKRPRVLESNSESSDDELLEFYRRRAGSNQVSTSGNSRVKKGIAKGSEFARKESADFARDDVFPPPERKRNTLDVYDFDEYDDLDDGYFDTYGSGRIFGGSNAAMRSGSRRGLQAGSSKRAMMMADRKRSFLESTSSENVRGSSSFDGEFGIKNKLPVPALKERIEPRSNEAIRLQGKNGVLKLMVKNKVGGPPIAKKYEEFEGSSMSRSRELTPKNAMARRSVYLEQKVLNDPNDIDRVQIGKVKPRNTFPPKGGEDSDEQSEESEEPPRILSSNAKTPRPTKRGRSEAEVTPSPETVQASKSKEAKVKRGSGTEKQLLREKIRNLLVSAGWTIDYRPRRNRDYFDAVYINPAGTAYWSIIKAYDALQKQIEEDGAEAGGENPGVNLIPDDALSKLTRQTQKKLEKEMKRKNRENNQSKRKKKAASGKFVDDDPETDSTDSGSEEEKLSSFIKQSGNSKGRLHDFRNGNGRIQGAKERIEKPSAASSHVIHGRKTKKIGRCTLLVRNADKGLNSEGDNFVPYKGKRTILSWLIDSGMVKLSEKVLYMNRRRTRVMLEGWITRDGIHCGCCSKILTVSKFEIHAASKLRQPYQNICLPSGVSLLQCQVNAWNSQDESQRTGFHAVDVDGDDPNDDTCGICGDGGNLICCDGCPSTLHQSCVGIEMLPPGDWHCPHCSCKFCGLADVEPFQSDDNTSSELVDCSLCERKYHKTCIPEMNSISYNSSNQISFCGRTCQELFEQLQKLLGVKHDLESGLSWSLIHRNDLDAADLSHRGFSQKVEWNAKLGVSLTIMNECFLPITDRRSGISLIQNVLYNCRSNFNRLNYGGFYTAILERGDEIISAASIRIHGSQLAEMPFIGTRHIYRRQGMCRRLLVAIETALRSLKVEKLIIPAISDMMHTWTKVFGFNEIGESQKQEMTSLNMLVFPGTDMLQKKLVQVTSKGDVAVCEGTSSGKDEGGSSPLPDLTKGSDVDTSPSETTASDPLPHNDLSIEKSDVPQNDHIAEKSDAGLSVNAVSLPNSGLDVPGDVKEPIECKMSQETRSSSELEDKLVKCMPNDITNCSVEARESVKNDRHVDQEFAEAVVGIPDSVTDVKNPSSLDANHDTQFVGKPELDIPTENNDQAVEADNGASSKLNDKTAESVPLNTSGDLDSAIEDSVEPLLKSELDASPVKAAGFDEPRIQAEGSKPDPSTSGNIQLHDEGETENDLLEVSGASSNGTLTSVVCSDSILEPRSLSPVQVADHSQIEQQFEVTVPDEKLISMSRADHEFNGVKIPKSFSSIENKADNTHDNTVEVAGVGAGCNSLEDGSAQISEC